MARGPVANPQITIEPNPNRVIVRLDGTIIADSSRALVMRAPGTPDQHYIPREDVDMTQLSRTAHVTHCPYKWRRVLLDDPRQGARGRERGVELRGALRGDAPSRVPRLLRLGGRIEERRPSC